jgi:hypothetical protein
MAVLLFRLNGVPDDEAADVRRLLVDNGIEWHETSAGLLGISIAGIWLSDASRYHQARQLIDAYEAKRAKDLRAEYDERRAQDEVQKLTDRHVAEIDALLHQKESELLAV